MPAAQSSDDKHSVIDMTQSDINKQTVTLCFDEVTGSDDMSQSSEDYGNVCEMESGTLQINSADINSVDGAVSAARDCDTSDPQQRSACPEDVNLRIELMAALKKSVKEVDSMCSDLKEIRQMGSDVCKTMKKGNRSRDVT